MLPRRVSPDRSVSRVLAPVAPREGHPAHVAWLTHSGGLVNAICCDQQHYGVMPTSITIRDVPDEVRDELAARAALSGRSLQEYLRARLAQLAAGPDAETLVARVRQRKAALGSSLPADRILAHRDTDRR